MRPRIRDYVVQRALGRCEYRGLHKDDSFFSLHVEHIIPRQHDGGDDPENLALSCRRCNLYKGPNLAAFDPETGEMTALFHPRREAWDRHFEKQGALIVGLTPSGRATVNLLRMNEEPRRELRARILARDK